MKDEQVYYYFFRRVNLRLICWKPRFFAKILFVGMILLALLLLKLRW